jgi:thymidylate synthase
VSLYGISFHVRDLARGYVSIVRTIMQHGVDASPRGALTREILGATIVLPAWAPMLPIGTERKVSTKLAAIEALQVIGGYSDAEQLFRANENLREYADQGSFHGAYGPRVRPQIDLVLRRLSEDPQTRRAVVTLWDPLRDSIEGVKNYPCATELQFMVRDERVDLHVTMRANDAWHGLAYDAFVFSQLQYTVARELGRTVGKYVHHAASLHVYEEHWPLVDRLVYPDKPVPWLPAGLPSFERARRIGGGEVPTPDQLQDPSVLWYAAKVADVAP